MAVHRYRLRELEALRALITAGTTVGAAQRLGISQSAVSRALTQLESRVGRALFERASGRIEPTEHALRLNDRLDPLFATLADIEGTDWSARAEEPLRLIIPPTLAHHFIIPKVAKFIQAAPNRRVQLDIQATDVLVSGILDGRYDLGLTSGMIQRSGVTLIPWRKSKVVCAMPENHPLARNDVIVPADLQGADIVGFLGRLGTRTLMDQILGLAGVQYNLLAETATNMAALELVREGLGVTFINPFPLVSRHMTGIVVRPFKAPIEYRTSFVVPTGKPPTDLARQFMRFVRLSTPKDPYSEPA
ncbi:LysR family transcriptional regulator [Roseibium aquae]|nr:LysR family transcriptional regulator [Roseibium aquae]